MKKLLFSLTLLITTLFTRAQTNLDSLYSIWQDKSKSDEIRTESYSMFIQEGFLPSNADTVDIMADELITFGKKMNYPKGQALGLSIKGKSSKLRADFQFALDYHTQSLKIYEQLRDKGGMAGEFINIGIIRKRQGQYPQALSSLTKGLKLSQQLGDQKGVAKSFTNIGTIYKKQGDFHKALDYYNRSLNIYERLGDKKGIAGSMINMGTIYRKLGNSTKALDNYQRAIKICEEIGQKNYQATGLNNIANIHQTRAEYSKSLIYFDQSLRIYKQLDNQQGICISLNNIGDTYWYQGEYQKALEYFQKSYDIAVSIGSLEDQKNLRKDFFDTYKAMGNINKALEYHELYMAMKDSISNQENTKKLAQMEMQFEFDKKNAIAKAKQEKKDAVASEELRREELVRNSFVGGFLVVLLFAGVFFVQRNRIVKEKERSDELLLNILPAETAKELKEKGHSDAQLIDQVTVLFTDFKGFTALSEQVSPKELVINLHACFSEFDHICEKYGIEKIKTIGDAYMAAGGLPTPNNTHPTDVVKAALEMAEVIDKGIAQKRLANQPFFEVRVGVHTGPVVAGIVGVKKFQYDIWGDTVNTASRMESSGDVGKVNISHSTYKLLQNKPEFLFESRGKIAAKGKGKMEMYFVYNT